MHGDYAPKNILLGRDGAWVLDAEVAHVGHPVFDLAFFLAFPLLTAVQKPALAGALRRARGRASSPPTRDARRPLVPPARSLSAHTGAMVLARTDGRSPAAFLDAARPRRRARKLGERLLLDPAPDLAAVVAACG